jgi:hypothetical protein
MSTFVLIIWLSVAWTDGAIATHEFSTGDSCLAALRAVRAKAKWIDGVCVKR